MNQEGEQRPCQRRNSRLAEWSLVLGIIAYFCLWIGWDAGDNLPAFLPLGALFTITSIVCGHVAISVIKSKPDVLKGSILAVSGTAMGYVALVLLVFCFLPKTKDRGFGGHPSCQPNLHQFDVALMAYCYPPITGYPPNLSMLSNDVGPNMFVCPESGNHPEEVTNAMEWMDYIYVTGLSPSAPPGIPVMICPPENHKGKGGNILDTDHSTKWYSSPGIDCIISNLLSPTSSYVVIVSKRLTEQSKGKYRSKL